MVQLLEPVRQHPNLILHCGAHKVDRYEVEDVPTPRSTSTWNPIPHIQLIQRVEHTLEANNLTIGTIAHSLTHDGARYFGLMEIQNGENSDDYCWVLGLRNSHDKTLPAGVVAGASVFICDNLSFSGEVKLARKHTRFIVRDLPQLVESAIGRMLGKWHDQHLRFTTYQQKHISNQAAHDLIIRATDVGVCSNKLIPAVLHEWREPEHKEFQAKNVWSLFNAFTSALKQTSLNELPKRSEALHCLLDSHVGLAKKFSTS
jgi:hypothetical protein